MQGESVGLGLVEHQALVAKAGGNAATAQQCRQQMGLGKAETVALVQDFGGGAGDVRFANVVGVGNALAPQGRSLTIANPLIDDSYLLWG